MDYPEWKTRIAKGCLHKTKGPGGRGKMKSRRSRISRCMFKARNQMCRMNGCPMKEEAT